MTSVDDSAGHQAYTESFEPVRAAEREWIARRRQAAGLSPPQDDLVGLAFSGGGIRSAIFNLGVLQALEAGGMMRGIDYLSSVSGGGYIASCYSWLRASLPKNADNVFAASLAGRSDRVLDWLRSHGKYLTSHRGFSIWTLIASVLAATLANVLVLAPAILFAIYGLTLAWLPIAWPSWLAMPGAQVPQQHHGFLLLLALGLLCLALFPALAIAFAFVAGIRRLAAVQRVDRLRVAMGRLIIYGLGLLAVGLIPVVATLGETTQRFFASPHAHQFGKHLSYLAPILSGLGSLLADKLRGGKGGGRLAMVGVSLLAYGILILAYLVVTDAAIVDTQAFLILVALSVILAFTGDINRVSIHDYYRARLSDAFLTPVEGASCADPGQFALSQITPDQGAPLQLINTTLNTTSSTHERLRSRQGASFFFSPLYSGSLPTGFRRVDDYAGGAVTLSSAFTTSGAAVDPDMYVTSARAVSFLMALFNVRLGFWGRNPRCGDRHHRWLPWWWIFIAREMLGIGLDEKHRHVHLSDGGGFENLGLYELVRRRVRYLIVSDAGADPLTSLSDLGRAIERVRVDFGAEIDLAADRLYRQRSDPLMQQPFVFGQVRYADGSRGEILYLRPVLCAGLSADIYSYWRAQPSFPDEPTSQQFFAEPQFEAYRALGEQIVGGLLGEPAPRDVAAWFARIRADADDAGTGAARTS